MWYLSWTAGVCWASNMWNEKERAKGSSARKWWTVRIEVGVSLWIEKEWGSHKIDGHEAQPHPKIQHHKVKLKRNSYTRDYC